MEYRIVVDRGHVVHVNGRMDLAGVPRVVFPAWRDEVEYDLSNGGSTKLEEKLDGGMRVLEYRCVLSDAGRKFRVIWQFDKRTRESPVTLGLLEFSVIALGPNLARAD